jgi:hypothetical protein
MDNRKNNGGHSTKATRPDDKRKNKFKEEINEAFNTEDIIQVLTMLKIKAIGDQDVPAAKLFLEYIVGKPDQTIDVEGVTIPVIDMSKWT